MEHDKDYRFMCTKDSRKPTGNELPDQGAPLRDAHLNQNQSSVSTQLPTYSYLRQEVENDVASNLQQQLARSPSLVRVHQWM